MMKLKKLLPLAVVGALVWYFFLRPRTVTEQILATTKPIGLGGAKPRGGIGGPV